MGFSRCREYFTAGPKGKILGRNFVEHFLVVMVHGTFLVAYRGFGFSRRKIRLIESNAKCRYLKYWPVKGLCGSVYLCK
jgi:hypothetical protein